MVGERIDGHAVGLLHGSDLLGPGVRRRIDDREHGAGGVREGGEVKALVAPVVPDLVAAARLQDRGDDLTRRGADDHRMPRAAQEQFLVGGVERDPARIAGRDRVFFDELPGQRVNDRDRSTWVALVRWYGKVEQVRLGTLEDQLAQDGAFGDGDEGGERDRIRAVGHEQELILWIIGHFIGPLRAARPQRGDNGARGEVDDLDRAIAVGRPELAEIVHQHASGPLRVAASVKPTKAANLPDERVGACVDQVHAGVTRVGQVVDLALVIDETDIEGPQAAWWDVRAGNEGDLPQALRCILRLCQVRADDVAHRRGEGGQHQQDGQEPGQPGFRARAHVLSPSSETPTTVQARRRVRTGGRLGCSE